MPFPALLSLSLLARRCISHEYKPAHPVDPPPAVVPHSSVLLTAMIPPNTNHPIPPSDSQFSIPNLSAMPLQDHQPSPQQQGTLNPALSSHVHPIPILAFPLLHRAEPLTRGPSGAMVVMHGHDYHIPLPMPAHQPLYSAVSVPPLQVFRPDIHVANIEAREDRAAIHNHL
jgi:hypothetical protein